MKDKYLEILHELNNELFGVEAIKLIISNEFFNKFNNLLGVYAIYDHDLLIYVGETGNLKKRMKDIRNTQNHNIRSLLGESNFGEHEFYWKATSRKKFHPDIEDLLGQHLESNIFVRCVYTVRQERARRINFK